MITIEIDWVWAVIILIVLSINISIDYSKLEAAKEERDASNMLLVLFLQGIASVNPNQPVIDRDSGDNGDDDNDNTPTSS